MRLRTASLSASDGAYALFSVKGNWCAVTLDVFLCGFLTLAAARITLSFFRARSRNYAMVRAEETEPSAW